MGVARLGAYGSSALRDCPENYRSCDSKPRPFIQRVECGDRALPKSVLSRHIFFAQRWQHGRHLRFLACGKSRCDCALRRRNSALGEGIARALRRYRIGITHPLPARDVNAFLQPMVFDPKLHRAIETATRDAAQARHQSAGATDSAAVIACNSITVPS